MDEHNRISQYITTQDIAVNLPGEPNPNVACDGNEEGGGNPIISANKNLSTVSRCSNSGVIMDCCSEVPSIVGGRGSWRTECAVIAAEWS